MSPLFTPISYIVLFGLARVLGSHLQEHRQVLLNKISKTMIVKFSKEMMNYLMKMDYNLFKTNSALIHNSFIKSLQGIERLNRFVVGNVLSNIIEILVVSGMLFFLLGPKYFVTTSITYIVYILLSKWISKVILFNYLV